MAEVAMIHEKIWNNGPKIGGRYDLSFPGVTRECTREPKKETLYPSVTGTSVLGIKFNGGVVIAADKLGAYGSLIRFRNVDRLVRVTDSIVLGGSGDYADFQFICREIQQKVNDDESVGDGFTYTPRSLFSWLTRIMYVRRSKFDPLWNTLIVAGMQDDEPFLGYIDKIGVAYEAPTVATGFGLHMAQPILREVVSTSPSLSRQQAIQAITRCMTILFYRDARSINKYDLAVITKDGVEMMGPIQSHTNWDIAHMVNP